MRKKLTAAMLIALWSASLIFILPLGADITHEIQGQRDMRVAGPCDFIAFWAVGRMAASGEAGEVFQPAKTLAAEAANPASRGLQLLWYYPPPALLLPALVQSFAFFPAFFIWDIGLILTSVLILRLAALPWRVILAGALSPAALFNADVGQLGFLVASLFIGGLFAAGARPLRAGGMFGALVFKPQAGILAPVLLLARSQWPAIAIAAVVALGLCALTTALYGTSVWRGFITQGLPVSHAMLVQPFPRHAPPTPGSDEFYGTSVFWMLRSLGAGTGLSFGAQAAAAGAAIILCWRAWRRPSTNVAALAAFTACLALLATPYAYVYDLCTTSLAFAALAQQERRILAADVLVFTWPFLGLLVAFRFYLELTPVILCIAAARAGLALRRPA
jgi:hypothetical protein